MEAPAPVSASLHDGRLVIALHRGWGPALSQIDSLAFYPYDEGSIDYAATQTLTRSRDGAELSLKPGDQPPGKDALRGVLIATEKSAGGTAGMCSGCTLKRKTCSLVVVGIVSA